MSPATTDRYMKKSDGFVSKWVKHYKERKNVDALSERGTHQKKDDKAIIKISETNVLYSEQRLFYKRRYRSEPEYS